jgi:hypothetical protein
MPSLAEAGAALGSSPPDGDGMAELLAPARAAITDVARQKIRALRQRQAVGIPGTTGAHA